MTIREALSLSPNLPRLDREVLLSHSIVQDRIFLVAHDETNLTPVQEKQYRGLLYRATKHEPIAYILEEKEFYGRNFSVGSGVLIPRPETELLVEQALKYILPITNTKKRIAIVDVGTGTSAIITSIFLSSKPSQRKNISWFAIDNDALALSYARRNAKRHGVAASIRFVKSDLLKKIAKPLREYDEIFVIANLPYLSRSLYKSTAPNVLGYEPKNALVSGIDGLVHYRRLLSELQTLHAAGIETHFFFEISPEQAKKIPSLLFGHSHIATLEIVLDLAGKARVVIGNFGI